MKCSYCQHENSDGNLFCSECGRKLKASENQGVSEVNNTGVENAKKKKRRSPIRIVRNVLISIALIIVLIIVSLFVYITSTPFVRRQYMEYDYFFVEDMYDHGFLRKNSQLYMGLIYIDDGEYDQAYEIFKKVYDPLRRFPNTDFIDGYELYVALALDRGDISYEQLGEVDYAITGYERELVATRERVLENFYYLADNSAVESEADSGSIQEPISNSYRIYIDGKEILSDYVPKKQGETLLFPAMTITKNGYMISYFDYHDEDLGGAPTGYTAIDDFDGVKAFYMNETMYVPEYGILEQTHEPFGFCYRLKTKPIVEGNEVYVDLETLQAIAGVNYDLNEAERTLRLVTDPDTLFNIFEDDSKWYDVYPEDEDLLLLQGHEYFKYIQARIQEQS